MDDLFLYNYIKQAIKQRKQFSKDTEQQNFAQSYCRRELIKKKLNLNTSNSNAKNKMKSLMKNFTRVQTYVDLNELLYSINLIRTKELAQKKLASLQQQHRASRISRMHNLQKLSKPSLSYYSEDLVPVIDPIEALKDKFRGEINQRIKKKYMTDNSDMTDILKYLEEQSHLNNSLLKNNSTNYLSYLNQQLQRIQKTDEIDGDTYAENWQIFRQLTQSIGEPLEKQPRTQYFKSTNLNSKQKKQQNLLLHKISTFLQIALQNQHKQKWATKDLKKFRTTHGSFRFKKDKDERSKFFLKGINIDNNTKEKSFFQNVQENPNPSNQRKKSTVRKNQKLIKKIKSQQKNIFGKKSLDHQSYAINQTTTNSKWKVTQSKNLQSKQNIQIFKLWDNNSNLEQRRTAPVNHDNIMDDFTCTMTKENNRKSRQKEEPKERTEVFLTDVPKNEFLINKKKQSREYTFVTPNRKPGMSKTFVVGSNANFQVGGQVNESMKQIKFSQSEVFSNQIKDKLSQTQACQKLPKTPVVLLNPSLKTQKSFKKSQSTKTNLISQNFTFKNRGKKQQIMNKLESFIEEINNEEKMSKAQNEYYDLAINHLHDLSKTTYKNYEPEALAGYEEISELKKFVNGINPSVRTNKPKKKMIR